MVVGIERFREYFKDYQDSYVLIGGVAAAMAMARLDEPFRATKDLDVVLVVEALNVEFVAQFWAFIHAGGYRIRQNGSEGNSPVFYRFQNPQDVSFPVQVELFSRVPDGLQYEGSGQMTTVPVEERAASLSAIILDDDYYHFLVAGADHTQEVSHIGADRLVPLKAHAWLNKKAQIANGFKVDSRDVKKHFNDVISLSALLTEGMTELPERIASDLTSFLGQIPAEFAAHPDRYRNVDSDQWVNAIKRAFNLD